MQKLIPKMFVDSIRDIPVEELVSLKIKGVIFDLDNTITEWNNPEISAETIQWFKDLNQHGLTACLVSNNKGPRVMAAAQKLGIPYVAKATKPRRRAFRQAMELLKTRAHETAMVGDQIFTDVLGGNRMGLFTILVTPINPREFIGTRLVRRVERFVLGKIRKQG